MLKNKTSNNEELQQYLNEKAYETASLGETSADELAAVPQQTAEVDFFRESDINQKYKQGQLLAQSIQDYEQIVVQDHLALDLYR